MKRILAAVDASESSKFVIAHAVDLARTAGAKVRLLRAVSLQPSVAPLGGFVPTAEAPAEAIVSAAQASVRALLNDVPEELRDGADVDIGTPSDVICTGARAYDADVVVIGAHKYGLLARVLGTTAAKVVNRIDRPVVVVRPPRDSAVDAEDGTRKGAPAGPAGVRAHDEHVLLEAATLAGAATGIAAGAIAGPPGAVVGGVLGTAVGMLAGQALEGANAGAESHDQELDAEIGVTRGDLGAREQASKALTALENARRAGTDVDDSRMLRAGSVLRREHDHLETVYDSLLAAYRGGDWSEVQAQWDIFEPALRTHMEMEEKHVFPVFRTVDPEEAAALLAEHDELRRLLGTLSVGIDLHAVSLTSVAELIGRLRAHGAREDVLLYPWMDQELGPEIVQGLSPAA